jgi:hypothetical protein
MTYVHVQNVVNTRVIVSETLQVHQ